MPNNSPMNPLLLPRVLWSAMFFSVCMYYLILVVRPESNSPVLLTPFVKILAGVGVVVFILAYFLPEIIFRNQLRKWQGPLAWPEAARVYFIPLILRLALAESVAIYGLVAAMTAGIRIYYPFWIASIFLMVISFPTKDQIMSKIEKHKLQ